MRLTFTDSEANLVVQYGEQLPLAGMTVDCGRGINTFTLPQVWSLYRFLDMIHERTDHRF